MLASPWPAAFTDRAWAFELKWDGFRVLIDTRRDETLLWSRNGNDITARFPSVQLPSLPGVVLDGELVVMDASGRPSFGQLASGSADVSCVAFDVLVVDGLNVTNRSFRERRDLLSHLSLPAPFAVNDVVETNGEELFAAVEARALEGIVAKRWDSRYEMGRRSPHWRKVLNLRTARCVVAGYTPSESDAPFAALVLGMWRDDELVYVGRVGSGFSESDRREIKAGLDEMAGPSPFAGPVDAADAVFCEPMLVAHVAYRSWTEAGMLRHPVFKGFGPEPAESVRWEEEVAPSE